MKVSRHVEVGLAAFKARLSSYLRRVREGVEFTVLNRDTPIARVIPMDQPPAGRAVIAYLDSSVMLRVVLGESGHLGAAGAGHSRHAARTAVRASGFDVIGAQ